MLNINCKGRLLQSDQPIVMGILNVTPDSFYSKGRKNSIQGHIEQAGIMLEAGASILDIGGMSTRPGSVEITEAEEKDRVLPVISQINKHFPAAFISIDTYRSVVAKEAVREGADIINDISAGDMDKQMHSTVAVLQTPYIAMHMLGTPQNMQQSPHYEHVTKEVMDYFIKKIHECETAGIKDIVLDPGFGFGKTLEHNYRLLKELSTFHILEKSLLVGISRKGMIYKPIGSNAENALNGTTAVHMLALQQGVSLLRVHDVKEAMECIQLYNYYQTI